MNRIHTLSSLAVNGVTRCDASGLVVRGGSVDKDDTRLPTHEVEEVRLTSEVINQVQVDEIEAWMMVARAWASRRTAVERRQVLGEIKKMKSYRESNSKKLLQGISGF